MSDNDLIRRGDARRLILSAPATFTKRGEKTAFDAVYSFRALAEKIAALPADPQIATLQAERARLVETLQALADEPTSDEMPGGEFSSDRAEWHRGYDAAVRCARALLAELGETK